MPDETNQDKGVQGMTNNLDKSKAIRVAHSVMSRENISLDAVLVIVTVFTKTGRHYQVRENNNVLAVFRFMEDAEDFCMELFSLANMKEVTND